MASPKGNILAAILAAGTGSRFGSCKPMALLDGQTLIERAVRLVGGTCAKGAIAVVGHDWEKLLGSGAASDVFFVVNDKYQDGIGSSIAAAANAASPRADALLLALCDQPLVDGDHLRRLIDTWSGDANEIVATAFADTAGPPVLFAKGTFEKLGELNGDRGARTLFDEPSFKLITIRNENAAIDVDTPESLNALQGTVASRQ